MAPIHDRNDSQAYRAPIDKLSTWGLRLGRGWEFWGCRNRGKECRDAKV